MHNINLSYYKLVASYKTCRYKVRQKALHYITEVVCHSVVCSSGNMYLDEATSPNGLSGNL